KWGRNPIDMATAELEKLRNVGLLGQGGSGKTSLGEAMLFTAGGDQRMGGGEEGRAGVGYEGREKKKKKSGSTGGDLLSSKKHPFELIDTPGYAAFLADSINCMRAFGGAVFVLNPSVGLRVESERLWDKANDNRIGRLFFASKMDHEQDNVVERVDSMLEGLEVKGVHLQMPIGIEANFKGVVDLLSMKAYLYEGEGGKFTEGEIPGDLKGAAEEMRQKLMESVSETDDELLEKYL